MLRISRRTGERIVVGDEIVIEVLEVHGSSVRLGIDAPRQVPIYREELWLEVKRENEEAARQATELVELPEGFEVPSGDPDPT